MNNWEEILIVLCTDAKLGHLVCGRVGWRNERTRALDHPPVIIVIMQMHYHYANIAVHLKLRIYDSCRRCRRGWRV